MVMRITFLFTALALTSAGCGDSTVPKSQPGLPALSPNAPQDKPTETKGKRETEEYQKAIAPYVEKGRTTYPDAKKRYLAGLPEGHHLFVVVNLEDGSGAFEQVFVAVGEFNDGQITGTIASDIIGVRGYKHGDPYTFPESKLVDWLITRPDGSEEGNVVGKYLDEWQQNRSQK